MKPNKRRVIFISNGFGLSTAMSGGEVRLFNFISRAAKYFDCALVTTSGGLKAANEFYKKILFSPITVKCSITASKETFPLQRFIGYFISAAETQKKLANEEFDALYTSSDALCDINPAYELKKKKNFKWFCMLHHKYISPFKRPGFFPVNWLFYSLQEVSFKRIARRADCVFVLATDEGELIAKELRGYGYKGEIHSVKNGINLPRSTFHGPRSTVKDRRLAVYLGGLRPSKGLYDIVPAWKKVNSINPVLKLRVIGMGSDRDMRYLENEIIRNSLGGVVELAGYLPNTEVEKSLAKAFVFFLPSHEEGWGISVLEALLHNCYPVVYNLPAFKAFRSEVIKSECFDTDKIAMAAVAAFKNKKPKKAGKSFISSFSWDVISAKEIKIIRGLLP